jgi:hypothetical protein
VRPGDPHPGDDRLVADYYGAADPVLDRHLGRCLSCAARREALHAALDAEKRRHARRVDAYFTPARLDAQRAEVLARLGAPRRARVLRFPDPTPTASLPTVTLTREGRLRWFAAAAVAAMVGVAGAGWLADESRRHWNAGASQGYTVDTKAQAAAETAAPEPDDAALAAIDMALARPGAYELRALDALTLHSAPARNRR